jgi:CRP-like cAMP-binding protein
MKPTKDKPSAKSSPVRNDLLRALLASEYKHLSAKLERVTLKVGEVLYQADQRIEYVYFPETSVVAMIDTMADGSTIEVGIIGHEGMVGINIFLGGLTTPDKAVVQIPGSALRMKPSDLHNELRVGEPLQRLLLRYTQALIAVISQSVGCSQHHTISQRLARLLLTLGEYAEAGEFLMSQATIADMLGVRRVGVTAAASDFRAAHLINYSRGRLRLKDKAGLEKQSCECHRIIRDQFKSLLRDVPRYLSSAKA